MAAKWSPAKRAVWSEPFPPLRVLSWNGPQAVKGAPLWGAAQRTLDGEDRSEMITEEGKAGRTFGEKWSAILVPSPAASNKSTEFRQELEQRQLRYIVGVAPQVGVWLEPPEPTLLKPR